MWSNRIWTRKELWLVVLMIVFLSIWAFKSWWEARIAANLTPDLVIKAFQDAGFEINNVQSMDYYPGPMPPGINGLKFSTYEHDEIFDVLVVLYADDREAKQVATAVNNLNQRMDGQYGYAFNRGPIVLQVGAYDKNVAREFNVVLKAIK
jgi:hypothetical protein